MTAPVLSWNFRRNESIEADNIIGNNVIENHIHFGHDNVLFESNKDDELIEEDNADFTSISSKEMKKTMRAVPEKSIALRICHRMAYG